MARCTLRAGPWQVVLLVPDYGPVERLRRHVTPAMLMSEPLTGVFRTSSQQTNLSPGQLAWARRHPTHRSVLGEERIACLNCGRRLLTLPQHLLREHHLSPKAYRSAWGYRPDQPLMARCLSLWSVAGRRLPTRRRRRPDVDADHIVEAIKQGYTIRELARLLHCHVETVGRRLRGRASIWLKRRRPDISVDNVLELVASGVCIDEAARLLHCSRTLLTRRLRAAGIKPLATPARRTLRPDMTPQTVVAARKAGMSMPQLVHHFRESVALIISRLRESGRAIRLTPLDMGRILRGPRPFEKRRDLSVPAILHALVEGCDTLDAVARRLRCARGSVWKRLLRAGLVPERRGVRRADVKPEDVLECWRQGLSFDAIGRRFHCTEKLVLKRLHQAGLENPKQRAPRHAR